MTEAKIQFQFWLLTAFLTMLASCGGRSSSEAGTTPGEENGISGEQNMEDSIAVQGLRGTIPKEDVVRVFDRQMDKLLDCYSEALDDLEEIEGEIVLFLLVNPAGGVKQVHIRKSDLGSWDAERCIVQRVKRYFFPEPAGGGIAEVTYSMMLEAPYDNPSPLTWETSVVEAVVEEHDEAVERCIGDRTGIQITSYVGRGGVVLTNGVSADQGEDIAAARCLAEDMRSWEFPDPGHKLAKVEVVF